MAKAYERSGESGILVLDKETGMTSFDALYKLKRVLGTGKLGHTGTLDKFASGVLVVLVRNYTRLVQYMAMGTKTYTASFRFGTQTDTLDPEGEVIKTAAIPNLSTIQEKISLLCGNIMQRPPEYSALHIDGKRASERMRSGETIVMAERPTTIYAFEVLSFENEILKVKIHCSKGTYVRSLARDLGTLCNSCAYVTELRRIQNGPFNEIDAVKAAALTGDGDLLKFTPSFAKESSLKILTLEHTAHKHFVNGESLKKEWFLERDDEEFKIDARLSDPDSLGAPYAENCALSASNLNDFSNHYVVFSESGLLTGIIKKDRQFLRYEAVFGA